jgi:hypothetical protein
VSKTGTGTGVPSYLFFNRFQNQFPGFLDFYLFFIFYFILFFFYTPKEKKLEEFTGARLARETSLTLKSRRNEK